ncbi:MAG: site-2 protease family protein [Thermodesulfobacteriota bacterium]
MGYLDEIVRQIAVLAVPILLAVTCHEVAHGWAADKLGDDTARRAGRLTLNPIKHLDLVGTLAFLVTRMVGWAKPVPVNPRNFRRPRQDMMWVAAAGPLANLILAAFFAVVFRLLVAGPFLPHYFLEPLLGITAAGVMINVGLAIFNLVPVPPLDGSAILSGFLPPALARRYEELSPYGFIILLLLIFSGLVDMIIAPVISFLVRLLMGI